MILPKQRNVLVMSSSVPSHSGRVFRFGQFELREREGELSKNGVRVRLQDQPLRVLAELLANAGRVVTREELHQKLWSADTFVDFDVGLNTAIRKLRQALGDDADEPRYIETLARRGYRLLAPVADGAISEPAIGGAAPLSPAGISPTAASPHEVLVPAITGTADATAAASPTIFKSRRRWSWTQKLKGIVPVMRRWFSVWATRVTAVNNRQIVIRVRTLFIGVLLFLGR